MIILYFLLALLFIIILLSIIPVETKSIQSHPQSLTNYEESIRRIEEKITGEKGEVADYGHTLYFTHGKKTKRAIVFYHGFTNCPRQYEKLAKLFFEKGFNCYIPRIPYHGLVDLYTKEIGKLTLQDLIHVCDSSVDIAKGLGEEIFVLGLSLGGVMAAFNAQFYPGITKAFVLVPSFAWYFLPGVIKLLITISSILPNMFLWWDPIQKDKRPKPFSMYHHFSTKQMGYIYTLGLSVMRAAKKQAPCTKNIVVLTYENDNAVDEHVTKRLMKSWREHGANIDYYVFPKDLKIEHDIIDPLHPYDKTDIIYEKIFEYV